MWRLVRLEGADILAMTYTHMDLQKPGPSKTTLTQYPNCPFETPFS